MTVDSFNFRTDNSPANLAWQHQTKETPTYWAIPSCAQPTSYVSSLPLTRHQPTPQISLTSLSLLDLQPRQEPNPHRPSPMVLIHHRLNPRPAAELNRRDLQRRLHPRRGLHLRRRRERCTHVHQPPRLPGSRHLSHRSISSVIGSGSQYHGDVDCDRDGHSGSGSEQYTGR